jgi:hypothetical protein
VFEQSVRLTIFRVWLSSVTHLMEQMLRELARIESKLGATPEMEFARVSSRLVQLI